MQVMMLGRSPERDIGGQMFHFPHERFRLHISYGRAQPFGQGRIALEQQAQRFPDIPAIHIQHILQWIFQDIPASAQGQIPIPWTEIEEPDIVIAVRGGKHLGAAAGFDGEQDADVPTVLNGAEFPLDPSPGLQPDHVRIPGVHKARHPAVRHRHATRLP